MPRGFTGSAIVLFTTLVIAPPAFATPRPGILNMVADAESILVFHIDSIPRPGCERDLTDSLRYTHCYPILEHGRDPDRDWCLDLGDLLASRTLVWNHDGCGYVPQARVRFVGRDGASDLVVFTSRCDSARVGLLMIRPGAAMERCELADGGEDLLDLLAEALPDEPQEENPFAVENATSQPASYDEEPVLIERVDPAYPDFGRETQPQGLVILNVLVGEDGRVRDVRVVRGVPQLNDAAIRAVRQWEYRPARSRGVAVAAWTEASLDFHSAPANFPKPLPPFPLPLPPFPWNGRH